MTPAPFAYHAAIDLEDALSALASVPIGQARILAGGQTLIPSMAKRQMRPQLLVDIMRCADLPEMEVDGNRLVLGARLRQADAEKSALLSQTCGLLADALKFVAIPQVRSRGTVVGSLAQCLPGGELPVVGITLDAEVEVRTLGHRRHRESLSSLYNSLSDQIGTTALISAFRVAPLAFDEGWAFEEMQLRRGIPAIVCVAVTLKQYDRDKVASVRIGIGGLTTLPFRATEAEARLHGQSLTDIDALDSALDLIVEDAPGELMNNARADASYRTYCAKALVRRALEKASQRANDRKSGNGVVHHAIQSPS